MLNGLYLLSEEAYHKVYGVPERALIARYARQIAPPQTCESIAANPEILGAADVILSSWGMALVDEQFLAAAPKLKAIFYAAGAVGHWVTPAVAERGIAVVSAQAINSVPVAEYGLAMILLCLKHAFHLARDAREKRDYSARNLAPGSYRSIVGLISYGSVAKLLRERLRPFDLQVQVFDPFLSSDEANREDVSLVELGQLFATSDVVSVHTPLLPETRGLVTGAHLEIMKRGASFINTARGEVVMEEEMLRVLANRPDLQAVLDVTRSEPPAADSAVFRLPNVLLTPHIAGSIGNECRRMGRHIAEELGRFYRGEQLQSAVRLDQSTNTSHRPMHRAVATPTTVLLDSIESMSA